MMMLRPQPCRPADPRLNLLLSYGRWQEEPALDHLPRLLSPLGIHTLRARSGEEAAQTISGGTIHIAVVDLTVPLRPADRSPAAGPRLLALLRRLEEPPPTVVIRPPPPGTRDHVRGLTDALREGAFAVLDRPIHLESLLEVMRRILRRHYADLWPLRPKPRRSP